MRRLWRRFTYWRNRRQLAADLAEEMEFHRSLKERDGAAAEMGSLAIAREDARAVWIWPWLESIAQDLRYAARTIRQNAGFSITVIATLAVAIGLNTSLFTVFNAIAFQPWPVPEPNRVVRLYSTGAGPDGRQNIGGFSLGEHRFLSVNAASVRSLIAMREQDALVGVGATRRSLVMAVSGNYFRALSVDMALGRGFLDSEDLVGSPQLVAVLSHRAWISRFGGDAGIIGRTIPVEGLPLTVVGIASEAFSGTERQTPELWLPFAALPVVWAGQDWAESLLHHPTHCCVSLAGRLTPGFDRVRARSELDLISRRFHDAAGSSPRGVVLSDTAFLSNPRIRANAGPGLAVAFLACGMVLLLASANVGNLMLARATARRREIAVRLSLGAGRGRVVRQLMTECLVLAAAGGALGLWLSTWLPAAILSRIDEAPHFPLHADWRVVAFAIAGSVTACIAFGLAPALHGTRAGEAAVLKEGAVSAQRFPLRGILSGVQVALSLILLIGTALLVRGLRDAAQRDPGFRVRDTVALGIELPANAQSPSLVRDLEDALAAEPVALASLIPLDPSNYTLTGVRLPSETDAQRRTVEIRSISPRYFEVLGISLATGRAFLPSDDSRRHVIVNEAFARRFWPSEHSAVGKRVFVGREPREIVGVARDAYLSRLDGIEPAVFLPFDQPNVPRVLVRTGFEQKARAIVQRVEPRATVTVIPLRNMLDRQLTESRIGAALAGGIGLLALILASIGIGGVFAYAVEQRTREIGIRMALGARPAQVVRAILLSSGRALFAGLTIGLIGAALLSRLLRGMLYGISPLDPVSYAAACAILATAAALAGLAPSRRAARVDPVRALRWE